MGTLDTSTSLGQFEAAHRLGITVELLFFYTRRGFGRASKLRSLRTVQVGTSTRFLVAELDEFNALLAGPWPSKKSTRPRIPKGIEDHLRAESNNQCARCGSGIGVETAHIRPWATSRSHHHDNLLRICTSCHTEHDLTNSLSTAELLALKARLVSRTRSTLLACMHPTGSAEQSPSAALGFHGRGAEIHSLAQALDHHRIVLITGVGGIGKTQLLIRAIGARAHARRVLWVDVERHRDAVGVKAALRQALSEVGTVCSEDALCATLDAAGGCVVFDGIERATDAATIEKLEDAIVELCAGTTKAQFVVTSQVHLHRMSPSYHVRVSGLDHEAGRAVLEASCPMDRPEWSDELDELLAFCDGHALTLRVAAAMMVHFDGPQRALQAIERNKASAVVYPGRQNHNRVTSLGQCLGVAYANLTSAGRQLLWMLSECPAGLIDAYIMDGMLTLPSAQDALPELRRWHLVELVPFVGELRRTHVLGPVREYALERAAEDAPEQYMEALHYLADTHTSLVAVLELGQKDEESTTHALDRYAYEVPNLLRLLAIARDHPDSRKLAMQAIMLTQAAQAFFFVRGFPEQGAHASNAAADLALRTGMVKRASWLALQCVSLSGRGRSEQARKMSEELVHKVEATSEDPAVQADVALAHTILAKQRGEYEAAFQYASRAVDLYGSEMREVQSKARPESVEEAAVSRSPTDCESSYSLALGARGDALLALGRYEEAEASYALSIQHQHGSDAAVNRGQALHQLGNCASHLGRFQEAANYYTEAARIFYRMEMEEYLSNAISELGYTLLDLPASSDIAPPEAHLIEAGLMDLGRHAQGLIEAGYPLDHREYRQLHRKLMGAVMVASLLGHSDTLAPWCESLLRDLAAPVQTIAAGLLDTPNELFPFVVIHKVLALGALAGEAEKGMVEGSVIHDSALYDLLRELCHAHPYVRDTMRATEWFSMLLTMRWQIQGAGLPRMREFLQNFDDDVHDHLDLHTDNEGG